MTELKPFRVDKRKVFWTTFALAALTIALLGAWWRKSKNVRSIQVAIEHLPDGNDLIKEREIKAIVERAFEAKIVDMQMVQVDVQRVERALEEVPFVQNAEVFFDISNQLNVKVRQRVPVLRILDDHGESYYLDANGVKMPVSKYFSARVTVATGAIPPHVPDFLTKQKYLLKDLFFLAQKLDKDDFFASNLQQIHIAANGDFVLIPLIGNQKIILGNLSDLSDKLKRIKIFYEEAIPHEGWKKYGVINVKYKDQVVCKKV